MEWTLTNLLIQIAAGFLGAHGAATAADEHRFGFIGHSLAGLVGGGLSGLFLQSTATRMVTGTGSLNTPTSVETIVIQVLAGAIAGAIVMFAAGFVIRHRSTDTSK